jgi:hypothetical protein
MTKRAARTMPLARQCGNAAKRRRKKRRKAADRPIEEERIPAWLLRQAERAKQS